jgi:hypothetical protein
MLGEIMEILLFKIERPKPKLHEKCVRYRAVKENPRMSFQSHAKYWTYTFKNPSVIVKDVIKFKEFSEALKKLAEATPSGLGSARCPDPVQVR